MRKRLFGSLLAGAGMVAFLAAAVLPVHGQGRGQGQGREQAPELGPEQDFEGGGRGRLPPSKGGPVSRTKDGKPDMQGHWVAPLFTNSNILEEHSGGFGVQAGKSVIIDPPDGKIPYQPWALKQRDENRKPENAYFDNEGQCVSAGIPRIMLFALDVAYTPGYLNMIFDYVHHTRVIPMDGRKHLPEGIKLYMGDPIAHWEGDNLIIDSTNFNGKSWIALGGDFYTEHAHTVEKLWMTDSETLNYNITITDPTAFTRPWTMGTAAPFRKTPYQEMLEDSCHEGNADLVHLKNNYDQAHGKK